MVNGPNYYPRGRVIFIAIGIAGEPAGISGDVNRLTQILSGRTSITRNLSLAPPKVTPTEKDKS